MAEELLAVDVGGTFTDAVLLDPRSLRSRRAKAATTPGDRTRGVREAVERVLDAADADPTGVERVLHGTTAATNALLEDELARTALVTNEGFEDVLEIGRQTRPSLYDLDETRPDPIVPRDLRFGVSARLDADGSEESSVDLGEVEQVADELADTGIEAVVVGLLHAHRSDEHETAIADALDERLEGVHVLASATVSPEPREVERLSTAVVNAALTPRVGDYLERLERRLVEVGVEAPVQVLDSAAATVTPAEAAELPVRTALSGPAGGAAATQHLSASTGLPTLVVVDMGGTSTDVSLVAGGETSRRWAVEVAGRALQIPAVDVHTVGAGGGSIAWLDDAGGLRVGPESAGADPGPACYGRGGDEPTVTDANLALDRIPPSAALAGELELDRDAALDALADLELGDPDEVARSVLEIAIARTVRGLRSTIARHAVNPSQAALAAFGGAGPQFGPAWARRLGIDRVIVPPQAGVTSAQGLLAAPPRVERSQGLVTRLDELEPESFQARTDRLADQARARVPADEPSISYKVSARYEGQSHELTVELPGGDPTRIREVFEREHERQHGYTLEAPVELVTVRVQAVGEPHLPPREEGQAQPRPPPEPVETVRAGFVGAEGRRETSVFAAGDLEPGSSLEGPAIVASPDATAVVPPDASARVHGTGALILEVGSP